VRRVLIPVGLALAFFLIPESASAAHPCPPVQVVKEGTEYSARVAVVRVACQTGEEIVSRYYELLEEDPENVLPDARIDGLLCLSGLAMSQLFCDHGREHVFASIRPEDHPAQWGKPTKPSSGGLALLPHEAEAYMRKALGKRPALSFKAAYARKIQCGKPLGQGGRRCRMSWIVGDLSYSGRGRIRLSVSQQRGVRWHFSYKVLRFNEYCAAVIEGDDCTRVLKAHGTGRAF
jgi:hypothetical protein